LDFSVSMNRPARSSPISGGNGVYDKDPPLFCDLMLKRAIADYQRLGDASEPAFFDRGIPDMGGTF
jgi:predicted ATPase